MLPRIAMMSTFPPTKCGIATFAQSLSDALDTAGCQVSHIDLANVRVSNDDAKKEARGRDIATQQFINRQDVLIIQHEFGIFAGNDGEVVLETLASTDIPIITVLHTVLSNPSPNQERIMRALVSASDALVVMSKSAYRRLLTRYGAPTAKVKVIPHGTADLRFLRDGATSYARPQVMSWGLISRGKGLEWGILAVALLARKDIRVKYVVAGQVHPGASYENGTLYREELEVLASDLGVNDQIEFIDSYLDDAQLHNLMSASSAFLLPYDTKEQVTSGVLVEAITAGGPVISTRFPHANELLGYGAGYLVKQRDAQGIANAIRSAHTDLRKVTQMHARNLYMAEAFLWESVGEEYAKLANRLWRKRTIDGLTARTPDALVAMAVSS